MGYVTTRIGQTLISRSGNRIMVVRGYAGPNKYSVILVYGERAFTWNFGSKAEARAAAEDMHAELNMPVD